MNAGDKVTVKVKRQVNTKTGRRRIVEETKGGVVVAVLDAQELYPDPLEYSSAKSKHSRRETKFPVGDKIVQVLIDGAISAKNFHQSEVNSA